MPRFWDRPTTKKHEKTKKKKKTVRHPSKTGPGSKVEVLSKKKKKLPNLKKKGKGPLRGRKEQKETP